MLTVNIGCTKLYFLFLPLKCGIFPFGGSKDAHSFLEFHGFRPCFVTKMLMVIGFPKLYAITLVQCSRTVM